MKIAKYIDGATLVYDTENPSVVVGFSGDRRKLTPLMFTHNKTDYEFISEYFSRDHDIFEDFSHAYFYKL